MAPNSLLFFPWRVVSAARGREIDNRGDDEWKGLSRDLIERFIDVQCLERSLSRTACRGYRADLLALDRWMQQTLGCTLVSATSDDLRTYVSQRIDDGLEQRLLERLLASLGDFYRYAQASGCREDNPARGLRSSFTEATREAS